MYPRPGGYYAHTFKVYRGVTQGYPLSLTIFNMVTGAIICHWVMVVTVAEADVDAEGLDVSIQDLEVYFYIPGE